MSESKALVDEIAAYIKEFIPKNIKKEYHYHNLRHTLSVVAAVIELGQPLKLSSEDQELLTIAAWFHDTGYTEGRAHHEERSVRIATQYLFTKGYSKENTDQVAKLILATKIETTPNTLLQKIIKDADLNHLGAEEAIQYSQLLRLEWEATEQIKYTDEEWYLLNLEFCKSHNYLTPEAISMFEKQKQINITEYQQLLDNLAK